QTDANEGKGEPHTGAPIEHRPPAPAPARVASPRIPSMSSSSARSEILPQKRSAPPDPPDASSSSHHETRYNGLLTILAKSLSRSREKIASDAPEIIKDCYGDLTSLLTSGDDEDGDGVSSLVDLLLGKLDGVHDRFGSSGDGSTHPAPSTRLGELLRRHDIREALRRLEASVEEVEREEREFEAAEAADRASAREAIGAAKSTTRVSPGGKKRRIPPAETVGYHAHRLKLEHKHSLERELEEVQGENDRLEEELKSKWGEWHEGVGGLKGALKVLDDLGEGGVGKEPVKS
ncbi:hypothetical protein ACHAWF_001557, partial [Thalassiosira exigua]